jgi:hypothetical protein
MTDDCPVGRAQRRVADELERTREKRRALDRFESDVRSITATPAGGQGTAVGGFVATQADRTAGNRQVRRAFEEHVRPLSGDALETPATVHEAIATEFSRDVAVALATVDGGLPSRLKQAVLDESARRRDEMVLTERALDRERESLDAARAHLDEVRAWLDDRVDVRLSAREFGTLVAWHGRLDDHRGTLDGVAARRQRHLDRTTAMDVTVALSHRTLAEYLYAERSATFPVLDACASLATACTAAQRGIRTHLFGSASDES